MWLARGVLRIQVGGGTWFGGSHTLSSLDHVSFEVFVGVREVFFCMGVCDSRP